MKPLPDIHPTLRTWPPPQRDLPGTMRKVAIAALLLCVAIAAAGWAYERQANDVVRREAETVRGHLQNYTAVLASCLNGRGFYDKVTGNVYICSKPAEIAFKQ